MANDTRRRFSLSNLETRSTLLVVLLCGLTGVLVDLDHGVSLLLWKFLWPKIQEGRIWHTPLFIGTSLALLCLGTRSSRLRIKLVLGVLIPLTTTLVLIFSPYVVWSWT